MSGRERGMREWKGRTRMREGERRWRGVTGCWKGQGDCIYLYVMRPQFSMAPAAKSGMAKRSKYGHIIVRFSGDILYNM